MERLIIVQRSDQIARNGRRRLNRRTYKKRGQVEQSVGWSRENRRVGTCYDKVATSFQALINLAIIRRYIRILAPEDSSDRIYSRANCGLN